MAVTSVKELPGRDASFNDSFEREYRRTFQVITNDRTDGPIGIASAILVPSLFTPYSLLVGNEFDNGARVTRIEPRQDPDFPMMWEVTVTYSTLSKEESQENENPLLRPAEISMTPETFREPATGTFRDEINAEDKQFGSGLTNSAGELFDPPPEKDVSRPVLTIVRNELNVFPITLMDFADAVNLDTFLGAQPRQLKMAAPQFIRQHENDQAFWQVTYVMSFKRETWDLQLLNHGSYHLNSGSTKRTDFFNEDGRPILGNLTTDGLKLADGLPETFSRFKVQKQKSFASLGLTSSLPLP